MSDNNNQESFLPIESTEVTRELITTSDGQTIMIGGTKETATTLPDGSHQYEKTRVRVTTIDGHVIDHEHGDTAHHCPVCNRAPLSRHAMATCSACKSFVCTACTNNTDAGILCAPCNQTLKRQLFRAFLKSIT